MNHDSDIYIVLRIIYRNKIPMIDMDACSSNLKGETRKVQ